MDRIEKHLLKQALLTGFFEGLGGALFAYLFVMSSGKNFFFSIGVGIFIGIFLEFFWIYRVNKKIHLEFKKKYGKKYTDLVEEELKKKGIKKMLQQRWFFDNAKKDKKNGFL